MWCGSSHDLLCPLHALTYVRRFLLLYEPKIDHTWRAPLDLLDHIGHLAMTPHLGLEPMRDQKA
jgi:hypothetical protein|uniref:Uncharacterized protein n=2 Tax=Picea TaxID=3328 RepID=A0A124GMM3_PICGL|nr:hypothetical protein ABT39_MTgene1937 [Picea glauca]QHR89923.1 hypothetical protein Q903MT_gene3945 [Picea sitchensis]